MYRLKRFQSYYKKKLLLFFTNLKNFTSGSEAQNTKLDIQAAYN